MSEHQRSRDAFEERLRRIRVAEPSAYLRRRILDSCRQGRRAKPAWSWTAWRPELALGAAILLGLGALVILQASDARRPPAPESAEAAEVADIASRLAHTVDQGERTAEYLAARLAMSRRIHEIESSRRVRNDLRSLKGLSPWI